MEITERCFVFFWAVSRLYDNFCFLKSLMGILNCWYNFNDLLDLVTKFLNNFYKILNFMKTITYTLILEIIQSIHHHNFFKVILILSLTKFHHFHNFCRYKEKKIADYILKHSLILPSHLIVWNFVVSCKDILSFQWITNIPITFGI